MPHRLHLEDPRRDEARFEASDEEFDRLAFAAKAVELLALRSTRVAICPGQSRLSVEVGRAWGAPQQGRWAMLSVPPTASRRAIALAVASLAQPAGRPYALDLLLGPAPQGA